jgi:hypothetical protein
MFEGVSEPNADNRSRSRCCEESGDVDDCEKIPGGLRESSAHRRQFRDIAAECSRALMTLIMFRRVPELLANGNGKGTNRTVGSLEVGALTGVRPNCILRRASSYEIRQMFTLSTPLTPSGGKSRIAQLVQTINKQLVRKKSQSNAQVVR